jgi:prepilin-type N-terminal cleavage/methylation domain-containing protein
MRYSTTPQTPTSVPRSPRRARRDAFSLIELTVVVLIIGIFTALAVPAFVDSLLFYRIESAARRVKADLELARQTARLTSATQTITFTGATYTASAGVDGLNHPDDAYSVNLAAPPYEISNVVANFTGNASISFNGYGTPTAGGTVVLTAPKHQCTVTLDGATGLITITRNHAGGRAPE